MCVANFSSENICPSSILPCRVQWQSPGLANTGISIAHSEKVVELGAVPGLVQPSCQAASHALRRYMHLVYQFNDVLIESALVLWHCSLSVLLFSAFGCGVDGSWHKVQRDPAYFTISVVLKLTRLASFSFPLLFRLTSIHVSLIQDAHSQLVFFGWNTQGAAIRDLSTGTVCGVADTFPTTGIAAGLGSLSTISVGCYQLSDFFGRCISD